MKSIPLACALLLTTFAAASRAQESTRVPISPPRETGEGNGAQDPDPDWLQAVQSDLERAEYEYALASGGAWSAPNRAHELRSRIGADGVEVFARAIDASGEGAPWKLELEWTAWGRRGEELAPVAPAIASASENRVELARGNAIEWYANGERGIEQGFMLPQPPPGLLASRPEDALVLEFSLGDELAAVLAEDGASVLFRDPSGADVLRLAELHTFDAGGRELRSRFAFELGRLRIEIDDRGARYPLDVDPILTGPVWAQEGNQTGAQFGSCVATAGDVNADGYSDVIVGAGGYDSGQTNEGKAFVYLGSASGLATSAAWSDDSDQAEAQFGASVAPAGDVDGDGYADVLVGAPGFDSSSVGEGRAYLYKGSGAGLAATPAWTFHALPHETAFAHRVAGAGDVNDDGRADVIVATLHYADNAYASGQARVFLGIAGAAGLASQPAATLVLPHSQARLEAVASAGDVNGDGKSDVLLGTGDYISTSLERGKAWVHFGTSSGVSSSAAWQYADPVYDTGFGRRLSPAGDVDGDGYADIVVGAPGVWAPTNPDTDQGRVDLFRGGSSGPAPIPSWSLSGANGERFGSTVATAGDVNGDGYADVLLAGSLTAKLFLGAPGGLPSSAISSVSGYFQEGHSAATAGDVNGDGFSDVIASDAYYDNPSTNEGIARVYHGGSSGLGTSPSWSAEGDQSTAWFGFSVAAADLNADGYSEVIVGAPYFDNGEINEGRVFAYLGSGTGPSAGPYWTVESNQTGALFGAVVANAGDTNGDGYADLLAAAWYYDAGQTDEGRVSLYLGNSSAVPTLTAWTAEGNQASCNLGRSLASAGDVNGDGFGDVLIGTPRYDVLAVDEGAAWLHLGSPSGLGSAIWYRNGTQDQANYAHSLATAGDVNGDGFSDVIIGAPKYDNGSTDEGAAWVYLGSASGLAIDPVWTAESNQASANFGVSVASAGDLNRDGRSDVIVGADLYSNPTLGEGRAWIYLGVPGGVAVVAAKTLEVNQQNAYFGGSVAPAGDVNGDGYADVVIGARGFDNGQTDEGRVYVYAGSANVLSTTPFATFEPNQASAKLGSVVASAGDANGDGFADVIAGMANYDNGQTDEGGVMLRYGNSRGLGRRPSQWQPDNVTPLGLLGQSTSSDRFVLHALGRTPAGRGRIRLEWEPKPLGTLFNGSGLEASALQKTGSPGAQGSVYSMSFTAHNLVASTPYHWRARFSSNDPLFPHSIWMSVGGNPSNETKLRTLP